PALAAKAATSTIPIVLGVPEDPERLGLWASIPGPGAKGTGINLFNFELPAKRPKCFAELWPGEDVGTGTVQPANPTRSGTTWREGQSAAAAIGLQIQVLNASTSREINAAFANLWREPADALFVSQDGFFVSRRLQLATMAARHAIPMTSGSRDIAEVGGLM